jgi:hypothetical protein
MRVDESWEARVCMRVFSTHMSRSNENKSYMRVDKSWEARVCMRVSQLSCHGQTRTRVTWELIRVEKRECAWEFSQLTCPGQTRTRVAWELIRVEKRECAWEFSQLTCPGQTRTRVARELIRVEKREFVWEFSQLTCPGQTRTRVAWELRSESLHESFLNSHAPVKREQELHESWWELNGYYRVHSENFINSHQNLKGSKLMRVDESLTADSRESSLSGSVLLQKETYTKPTLSVRSVQLTSTIRTITETFTKYSPTTAKQNLVLKRKILAVNINAIIHFCKYISELMSIPKSGYLFQVIQTQTTTAYCRILPTLDHHVSYIFR